MLNHLLSDDDKRLPELLGNYLTNQGDSVQIAHDGLDGIRLLFTHHYACLS